MSCTTIIPREKILIQQGLFIKNKSSILGIFSKKIASLLKKYLSHRKLKINIETDV